MSELEMPAPAQPRPRRRGRPKMFDAPCWLQVRVDRDLLDWANEYADRNRTTMSDLVRDYLQLRRRRELRNAKKKKKK